VTGNDRSLSLKMARFSHASNKLATSASIYDDEALSKCQKPFRSYVVIFRDTSSLLTLNSSN